MNASLNSTVEAASETVSFSNDTRALNVSSAFNVGLAAFSIARIFTAFVTNSITIYAFASTPSLHTPFNIYLCSLLCANLINVVGEGPFDIYSLYNPAWLLGTHVCTFYMYNSWTVTAVIAHCHLAIAANRLWAIFWPNHYRLHNTHRTAVVICVLVYAYCHLWSVPLLVLDELYYRLPLEENNCNVNLAAQPLYNTVLQFVHYDGCLLAIMAAAPVMLYKRFRVNQRKRRARIQASPHHPIGEFPKVLLF